MGLSDEQRLLLLKGALGSGKVSMSMASSLYSSKSTAKSALSTLEFKGYIEPDVPGHFRIKKLPESVKEEYRSRKGDEQSSEETESIEA